MIPAALTPALSRRERETGYGQPEGYGERQQGAKVVQVLQAATEDDRQVGQDAGGHGPLPRRAPPQEPDQPQGRQAAATEQEIAEKEHALQAARLRMEILAQPFFVKTGEPCRQCAFPDAPGEIGDEDGGQDAAAHQAGAEHLAAGNRLPIERRGNRQQEDYRPGVEQQRRRDRAGDPSAQVLLPQAIETQQQPEREHGIRDARIRNIALVGIVARVERVPQRREHQEQRQGQGGL